MRIRSSSSADRWITGQRRRHAHDLPQLESAVLWFAREMWPLVTRAHPVARFVVVGARPTCVIRALPALGSDDSGDRERDGRAAVLWQAAVSVARLALAQGLQNKVLEAIAAGLPVVVTSQVPEGLPQDVAASCLVSAAPQDFADAVLRLLAMSSGDRTLWRHPRMCTATARSGA